MTKADDVPEWAYERAKEQYRTLHTILSCEPAYDSADIWADAFARYIAAHEPASVDPLPAIVQAACDQAFRDTFPDTPVPPVNTAYVDAFTRDFRARLPGIDDLARSVPLEPKGEG